MYVTYSHRAQKFPVCDAFRGDRRICWKHMDLLCEPIYKDADRIVSLRLWQLSNQIHADDLPGFDRDIIGVEYAFGLLSDRFHPLALLTSHCILPNVSL